MFLLVQDTVFARQCERFDGASVYFRRSEASHRQALPLRPVLKQLP